VRRDGEGWIVETHPLSVAAERGSTIKQAGAFAKKWIGADTYVPVGNSRLTRLARDIVGKETNVVRASEKVRVYVTRNMTPNAGIGILRDASEVFETKEGVCRDYAILTLTLLRCSGIPSRLVTGLVYDGGAFYYHAWVEVFDGKQWFGVDSTRPNGKVTAGHIKLAQGSVESAILFTFLDKVSVEVLETKGKSSGKAS
jgi:transglutaminase-like putative cysteine protease